MISMHKKYPPSDKLLAGTPYITLVMLEYVYIYMYTHMESHGRGKTSCPVWRYAYLTGITNLLQLLPSDQPTGSTWFPVLTIHIFTMQSAQVANMLSLYNNNVQQSRWHVLGEKGMRIFWNGAL